VKRLVDVGLSAVAMVVTAPLWALIAVAIKVEDGGPVLFLQHRVGKDGNPFRMLKFRTMTEDADNPMWNLNGLNERAGSPLFKVAADPRVTRVGRVLRATSLDELPQLVNVLANSMSLVGPRPALPMEFSGFDSELRTRTRMKPGVTGLWQAEARDNPAFRPYRRLDLFYLENWSLTLDFLILAKTASSILSRSMRGLLPPRATRTGWQPL